MANTVFDCPLFVNKQHYIQELASLEDVFDLLEEWPADKRGVTYEVLLKACRMAAQGIFPLNAVRENVRRFLIKAGVLANIEEIPLVTKGATSRSLGS